MKGGGDAVSAARAVLQTGEYDFAWNLQVEDEILQRLEKGGKGRVQVKGKETYRTPFGADGTGFPDLFACRPPRALFIENKTDAGAAAPDQVNWLLLLGKCPGIEVRVVRPQDMGELEEAIR